MRIFSVVAAAVIFASVQPGTVHASTDKNNTTVVRVYSAQDGMLIGLASGHSGEGCSLSDYAIIRRGSAFPDSERQFNIAMAAYLSGRAVNVRLSGCATTAQIGPSTYPVVLTIALQP